MSGISWEDAVDLWKNSRSRRASEYLATLSAGDQSNEGSSGPKESEVSSEKIRSRLKFDPNTEQRNLGRIWFDGSCLASVLGFPGGKVVGIAPCPQIADQYQILIEHPDMPACGEGCIVQQAETSYTSENGAVRRVGLLLESQGIHGDD